MPSGGGGEPGMMQQQNKSYDEFAREMLTSSGGRFPRWPGQLLPRYPEQDAMGKQSNIGGTLRKLASSVTWGVLQEDDLPGTLDNQ